MATDPKTLREAAETMARLATHPDVVRVRELIEQIAADDDQAELTMSREMIEDVADILSDVPDVGDMSKRIKHSDDCWKTHAPCLAERLADAMGLGWS